MKRIPRWLNSIFSPSELQDLDAAELLEAMGNPVVAKHWLYQIYGDLKQMNLAIDHSLRTGRDLNLTDLCARRRAYQDVLEAIKSAKKSAAQPPSHNQRPQVPEVDLDRLTV